MSTFISIMEGSTEKTIKVFKSMFENLGLSTNDVLNVKIYYNVNEPVSYEQDSLTFPVIIYTNKYVFNLADCTAGYGGIGPQGTVEVLRYLKMPFDENKIYQHRKNGITNLVITK